jgi:hypothetical protein
MWVVSTKARGGERKKNPTNTPVFIVGPRRKSRSFTISLDLKDVYHLQVESTEIGLVVRVVRIAGKVCVLQLGKKKKKERVYCSNVL